MSFKKNRLLSLLLSGLLAACLGGCGRTADPVGTESAVSSADTEAQTETAARTDTAAVINAADMFTDRDKEIGYDSSTAVRITLTGSTAACTSDSVQISGSTVTLTDEGEYIISGSLDNGQIVVEAENTDKLHVVLDGVSIHCSMSAAIYIKQADKVFITLAQGSENSLSNTGGFTADGDTNVDGVIFSKDDLTLNGTGSLSVSTENGHGIVSKDDFVIASGSYDISAGSHALSGKDSVRIADGSFTLTAGKDGIHAENTDDASLGFLYIAGGSFAIRSTGDGMDASAYALLEGGDISITSGQGASAVTVNRQISGFGGFSSSSSDADVSCKGIKADGSLTVRGGSIRIDAEDDALHAGADVILSGGTLELASGDDGIHADAGLSVSGGDISITKSYEGLEGQTVEISGGSVVLTASDDGINAAGGNDRSGFGGGMMRQDSFASDSSCYIKISGGTVRVNASGDGIDSNGNLYVSGGETYVSGPTDSGNGALDYSGEGQITGGIFVAAGSSGMSQSFSGSSTQGAMFVTVSSQAAGGEILLRDSSGTALISYTPGKSYNSVVISCPEIEKGATYTLITGESTETVEMAELIYSSGSGAGGFGGGKQPGGQRFGGMR